MVIHTHFKCIVPPSLSEGFQAIYTIPFGIHSSPTFPSTVESVVSSPVTAGTTEAEDVHVKNHTELSYEEYVAKVINYYLFFWYLK